MVAQTPFDLDNFCYYFLRPFENSPGLIRAYRAIDMIDFAEGFHRRDIGWRELERTGA